jgi:signal transduction histidine kinase
MATFAIDNVLSNAVKYTPDGKGIGVAAKVVGDSAVIEIRDEGVGIPDEKREQIFEPYYSPEDTNHHATGQYGHLTGGIGLGLTISRLIVEHHGGTLSLQSEGKNRGTSVTMTFPLSVNPL